MLKTVFLSPPLRIIRKIIYFQFSWQTRTRQSSHNINHVISIEISKQELWASNKLWFSYTRVQIFRLLLKISVEENNRMSL